MKKLLLVLLLIYHGYSFATLSVEADRKTALLGETFRLIFTLDSQEQTISPDLRPLKKDFTIVGTESNLSYTIVNGKAQGSSQWIILLSANKTGLLKIPPIQIGNQKSPEISIEVSRHQLSDPDKVLSDGPSSEVMLKTEASPSKDVFVNQQIIYTVKLYNSQRLLDAEYEAPKIADALVVTLGDSHRSETVLNGRNYIVEEQRYAIFPQKSGDLKIISPFFRALLFDAVPRRIIVHDKPIHLTVKPAPVMSDVNKAVFLAKQLSLTEMYGTEQKSFSQGDTLVREVTLQASGVPAELLPTIPFEKSDAFSVYSEKPELKNSANQNDLIGRAVVKATYLLNKSGAITIPALEITWFNTETGKEVVSRLPERVIQVKASARKKDQVAPSNLIKSQTKTPALTVKKLADRTVISKPIKWVSIVGIGFLFILLIIFILYVLNKYPIRKKSAKRLALKRVHAACIHHSPTKAEVALLYFAKIYWPGVDVLNLHQLAQLVHDASLKKQLLLLSEALYGKKGQQWQGDHLWQCLQAFVHLKKTRKKKGKSLPPINPS